MFSSVLGGRDSEVILRGKRTMTDKHVEAVCEWAEDRYD